MTKLTEKITCRICYREVEITESQLCPGCNNRIHTTLELRNQIAELDKIALKCRTEALSKQAELFFRENRRRNLIESETGRRFEQGFWAGVKNAPMHSGEKKVERKMTPAELAEFE